jgi:hypothetical protein
MKHREMLNRAAANGIIVGSSDFLDSVMEDLEAKAEPFIKGIKQGTLKAESVLGWLRNGKPKKTISDWQAEEIAQYIESEIGR